MYTEADLVHFDINISLHALYTCPRHRLVGFSTLPLIQSGATRPEAQAQRTLFDNAQ